MEDLKRKIKMLVNSGFNNDNFVKCLEIILSDYYKLSKREIKK